MLNHPDAVLFSPSADLMGELNARARADMLPHFSHSPAALDHGRYARFEAFLHEAGLIPDILPVSKLAFDPEDKR